MGQDSGAKLCQLQHTIFFSTPCFFVFLKAVALLHSKKDILGIDIIKKSICMVSFVELHVRQTKIH